MLLDPERRAVFIENVVAQALGTALGAGLLLIVAFAAGVVGRVPFWSIIAAIGTLMGGLALFVATFPVTEKVLRRRIIRKAEGELRQMTPRERMKFFAPAYPDPGFAKAPWLLDGLKEPFREEVNESLRQVTKEDEAANSSGAGDGGQGGGN